jgi:anti-anti-sigma factor
MVITDSAVNGWRVVILEGKFIVRNLTMIRKAFERAEREVAPGIAIDMNGVSQIDSSAITLLINFQRRVVRKDALLVLFGMRPDIAEIFSIVGIDMLFRICSTKNDFETLYALQQ